MVSNQKFQEAKRNIKFKLCNSDAKQNIWKSLQGCETQEVLHQWKPTKNIWKSCKVVKPKKFYINESLTPLRNTILYVKRQAKHKHPSVISICNSSDGSVVAWLHAASPSVKTKYSISLKKIGHGWILRQIESIRLSHNLILTILTQSWPKLETISFDLNSIMNIYLYYSFL